MEYKGVIPKDKLEETRVKVEEKANILVKTGGKVISSFCCLPFRFCFVFTFSLYFRCNVES